MYLRMNKSYKKKLISCLLLKINWEILNIISNNMIYAPKKYKKLLNRPPNSNNNKFLYWIKIKRSTVIIYINNFLNNLRHIQI